MAQIGEMLRKSRMSKGLTQEQAAQMLPFDIRTLAAYERDERRDVPWQAIAIIGQVFNDKQLLLEAIQQNEVWQLLMPKVATDKSLSDAGLAVLDELWDLATLQRSISHVIRDGIVSPSERETWETVKKRLRVLLASIIELLAADEGGDAKEIKR